MAIAALATAGLAALPAIISLFQRRGNQQGSQGYNPQMMQSPMGGQNMMPNMNNMRSPQPLGQGSAMGSPIGQSFRGQSGTYTQLNNRTPAQQGVGNESLQQLLSLLQGGGLGFEGIENQARENFERKTIPSIAERFTATGSGPRSSSFQGALQGAGSQLETNLAALKGQHGMNFANLLSQLGMQPQFDLEYEQDKPGFFKETTGNLLSNPDFYKTLMKLFQAYQSGGLAQS